MGEQDDYRQALADYNHLLQCMEATQERQTAALERIAAALERRDVVDVWYENSGDEVERYLRLGWVYLGAGQGCTILGRPRNVEGGGEGG